MSIDQGYDSKDGYRKKCRESGAMVSWSGLVISHGLPPSLAALLLSHQLLVLSTRRGPFSCGSPSPRILDASIRH